MKTPQTIILSVSALALLGATGLCAQIRATANIPFDFTVQNTTLPAGEYTMSKISAGHDLMLIQNKETRHAVVVLAPDDPTAGRPAKNVVVFHRIGDRYFLAEVKTSGVVGRVMPSKSERDLESEDGGRPLAVIIPVLSVR